MNSDGGKPDQQKHNNFTSKVHYSNANIATPHTSCNLTAEQYQNLTVLLNSNKPNTLANHVGSAFAMSSQVQPFVLPFLVKECVRYLTQEPQIT